MPQGAWAEELVVSSGNTVTISSNTNYEFITVLSGGTLIINEGVSVSTTASGYIVADGTVINYGTINGIAVYEGATFANHGDVSDNIFANGGTIYNTGTYVNKSWNNIDAKITPCEHTDCSEVTVEATCTHAGGKQTKCNVCYYIKSFEADENSPALGHSFDSHNGINSCTRCGLATYDAPELKSGYYQIANAGNLYWFADKVNNDYANFKYANAKLTADIVVNDITFDNNQDGPQGGQQEQSNAIAWPGIGNLLRDTNDPEEGPHEGPHEEGDDRIKGYEGIFDGQGHTISGLYSSNGAAGLVEVSAGNCIIKNVGIVNSYFHNGTIGVICTVCADNTEISNCYSNAICKGDYIGGIVGILLSNQARIKNCYSTSTLSSWNSNDDRTGGIVGQALNSDGIPYSENESTALGANISNCYTTYKQICSNVTGTNCEASVSADRFASGEIAWLLNGSVDGEGSWTAGATDDSQAWYQKLGENGDSYPVLAAAEGNTVYEQKIFNCGGTVVACNYNNTEEEDVTQPHDYQVQLDENEKPVFVWSEYYTTATLQVVCSHNAEHTANVEVTGEGITSEDTTPATCTTAGVRTYTAKATYEGVEYTGTKEVEISATGHDYQVQLDEDNNPVFVWSEDYTTATLQLVCSHNAEHTANVEVTGEGITSEDTTPATCTTAGVRTYTAKATYEGVEYTGTKEVEIPAAGHSFVDGVCEVCHATAVAEVKIGETTTGYTDIQEALTAALNEESATLTMLADVEINSSLSINKNGCNVTLDLNGHKISSSSNVIYLNAGKLTIEDNSIGQAGTMESDNYTTITTYGGSITIHGGTFISTDRYALDIPDNGVIGSLNGGRFISTNSNAVHSSYYTTALADGFAYYNYSSGKELESTIYNIKDENGNPAKDVIVKPASVKATLTIGSETTDCYTFMSAFNAALNSTSPATVTMLVDTDLKKANNDYALSVNKSACDVTIDLNGHKLNRTTGSSVIELSAGSLTITDGSAEKTGVMESNYSTLYVSGGSITIHGGTFISQNSNGLYCYGSYTASLDGGRFISNSTNNSAVETSGSTTALAEGYSYYNFSPLKKLESTTGAIKDEDGNYAKDVTVKLVPKVTIGGSDIEIALNSEGKYETATPIVLTDDAVFTATVDFIAPNVSYTRDMGSSTSKWGTIMLPFEVSSDEKVQYYDVSDVNLTGGVMTATPVETVAAGHPCLFKRLAEGDLTAGSSEEILISKNTTNGNISSSWKLVGTYTAKVLDARDGDYYYISADKFWHATGTVNVKPYRAYFIGEAPASAAKAMTIVVEDGEETRIEAVMDSEGNIHDASSIYDMQGRKLNSLQKGINIVNGKKVVVK